MSDQKERALRSLDELISTGDILLKNLRASDKDNGDSAMEAISVMVMQLFNSFGSAHPVSKKLFPAMDVIKSRIDQANYVGALWDTENFIKSLREIREIADGM